MNKRLISFVLGILMAMGVIHAQQLTIQEQLGYTQDAKLLIIHADDLGLAHSENRASVRALEEGSVNSGSIMVPCPWFPEIAAYAQTNPQADLGLHLTLTSEWEVYKWGPVLPITEVPSLVNEQGFFYASAAEFAQHAVAEEVEKELRAQVERALAFGVSPTHLDCHMFTLFARPEFLQIYLQLGRKYQLPVLLDKALAQNAFQLDVEAFLTAQDVTVDFLFMANPADFEQGMEYAYAKALRSLRTGLNVLLVHTAYDNQEMQGITVNKPNWGAAWRQEDFNFVMSRACQDILREENIQLVTWKEIRDKLMRK